MVSRLLTWIAGVLIAGSVTAAVDTPREKVVIGHFANPTPMQVAAAGREFAKATGWEIEWRKYGSGADMIEALSRGDIQIAELGSAPLVVAASQGIDLQIFMIAQVIGEAESLVVRRSAGIDRITDLKDKRIAVPFGSTAHFSLMGTLYKVGLTERDVTLLNMSPDQIAVAWRQRTIDGAFIWQPVQSQLLSTGKLLVGADETAEWGYPTFDGWVVDKAFASGHRGQMAAFVKVMDDANAAYLRDPKAWTPDSVPVRIIAERTGAAPDQVPQILKGYTFLPVAKQIGPTWLGGSVAKIITYTAGFLTATGKIDGVADDYSKFINLQLPRAAIE